MYLYSFLYKACTHMRSLDLDFRRSLYEYIYCDTRGREYHHSVLDLIYLYSMANRSLYRHAPDWFPTSLALQDTGTQHTTLRYSDLLAVTAQDPSAKIAM